MNIRNITTEIAASAALGAMLATFGPAQAAQSHQGTGMQSDHSTGSMQGSHRGNAPHYDLHSGSRYSDWNHHRGGLRYGIPGVYIYSGENNACGVYYRKWQVSGSRYWHDRFYDCRNG